MAMQTQPSSSPAWDSQLLAALTALKNGDFSVRLPSSGQGGTADQIAETYNATVEQLAVLLSECRRIAQEVGPGGKYGGQVQHSALRGQWNLLTNDMDLMANTLTGQIRNAAQVITTLANGEPTGPMSVHAEREMAHFKENINRLVARYGMAQPTT
jgi:hypothetical protein